MLAWYRGRVIASLIAFVVKDTPLWLMPVLTAAIIDTVVQRGTLTRLAILIAIAAVSLAQNYPTHWLFVRWFSGAVRQIGADLRNGLTERLQVLSIGYHNTASSAVVQSKVVRDVENVENMLIQVGHPLISALIVLTGALVMTALNVPAFLPVFALAVPLAVLLRRVLMRRSKAINERFRRDMEQFSSTVGDMASLIPITRAHGVESVAQDRVAVTADGLRRSGYTLDVLNGRFQALSWISMQLLSITCLGLAAMLSLTGLLPVSAGQVVLVGSYFALLTGNVTNVLMLAPLVSRGFESVRSIGEVLEEPDLESNEGKRRVDRVDGVIEFDAVGYRFAPDDDPALSGLSLVVERGESVAFVGPSGSGKSTVLNVALGFLRPTEGRVLLDGVDMQQIDLRSYRRFVSIVPQESVLFEGSIRDNVSYGLGAVSDELVREALESANALEFVDLLPEGMDTIVGQRGSRLSGGQRQRLAIARALIRDPRVLLLDEATSALDAESESKVQEALARLMRGRTTLIVAHRLATIRSADHIVVLEHGRIVEEGTHRELMSRTGRYHAMQRIQSA